ncbi:hypothetical protein ABTO78_17715 [Acinetobacter baumannii]|nr:hypothetical protein [Acinetobacter baumannii]HAV4223940.1 hypothetical protein [Acinetobacter baumannii]
MHYPLTQVLHQIKESNDSLSLLDIAKAVYQGKLEVCFNIFDTWLALIHEGKNPSNDYLFEKNIVALEFNSSKNERYFFANRKYHKKDIHGLITNLISELEISIVHDVADPSIEYLIIQKPDIKKVQELTSIYSLDGKEINIFYKDEPKAIPIHINGDIRTLRLTEHMPNTISKIMHEESKLGITINLNHLYITKSSLDNYLSENTFSLQPYSNQREEIESNDKNKNEYNDEELNQARAFIREVADECIKLDTANILSRIWIAKFILENCKNTKHQKRFPQNKETISQWIAQSPNLPTYLKINRGKRSDRDTELGKQLLIKAFESEVILNLIKKHSFA